MRSAPLLIGLIELADGLKILLLVDADAAKRGVSSSRADVRIR